MAGQRSKYTFQLNCDVNAIEKVIQDFIKAYDFKIQNKNGEQYYRNGDIWVRGYRYFNYNISGQTLNIYAWYRSFGEDVPVTKGIAPGFIESLNNLFEEINRVNNNNEIKPEHEKNINQNIEQQNKTASNPKAIEATKWCNFAFWVSIFLVLLSFTGELATILIYISTFSIAVQGLKSSERKKAIATIILNIISILIVIIRSNA